MVKIFKEFLSSLVQNIFITVIIALITIPVLISWVTGTFSDLARILNQEAPVWLVLLCTIGCLVFIRYKKDDLVNDIIPQPKRYLIEDSGFKWRVVDHKNGFCSVDQIPLCPTHESEYVLTPEKQYICREAINTNCDSKIIEQSELTFYWELAKSKANSIINKYETKY